MIGGGWYEGAWGAMLTRCVFAPRDLDELLDVLYLGWHGGRCREERLEMGRKFCFVESMRVN